MKWLNLILFFLPCICVAQVNISGKITNAENSKGIPDASVFISNATIGNKTNSDGSFNLKQVKPGKYELIVTVIGYQTHRQSLTVQNRDIVLPPIKLEHKITQLKEIVILPQKQIDKYFDVFRKEFLGSSGIADQCTIVNPEVLDYFFDRKTHLLSVSSSEFLTIENRGLGYRLKYFLNKFVKNTDNRWMSYDGYAFFEELEGTEKDKRKWEKARKNVYEGSVMHFLRSITNNAVTENGFVVMRLIRKPNPVNYGGTKLTKVKQTLIDTALRTADYVRGTDKRGLFALSFRDCLYVSYTKKMDYAQLQGFYKPRQIPSFENSILSFSDQYTFFDYNGTIDNPLSITFEGTWSKSRVADMLPVDYMPQ